MRGRGRQGLGDDHTKKYWPYKGCMGVVYKAKDNILKRFVGLKFLPSSLSSQKDAKLRFIQEAQTASILDHPNICTIHEIDEIEDGQIYISMAMYGVMQSIDLEATKKPIYPLFITSSISNLILLIVDVYFIRRTAASIGLKYLIKISHSCFYSKQISRPFHLITQLGMFFELYRYRRKILST
jgi:serine/threonine protein kinase